MDGSKAVIRQLKPNSPALPQCALWRYEEFLKDDGFTLDDSLQQLVQVTSQSVYEVALLAQLQGIPVGICMFVRQELNPLHDLSPWLASLYVLPEFRKRGIGRALVRAIENHARNVGTIHLNLYTIAAEEFYKQCGWLVSERFDWDGEPFVLMRRDL